MIQSIFMVSVGGEVLIEKHWRGSVNRTVCDQFMEEVSKVSKPSEVLPVLATSRFYLIHVLKNNVFLLAIAQQEVPPLLVLEFLHRAATIFRYYFGEVTEDSVKENFLTVYQLLDEMIDSGMPLTTEASILKDMIATPTMVHKIMTSVTGKSAIRSDFPDGTSSNVPWRRLGIKHGTNEVFFDLEEEVDCTVEGNGLMKSCLVTGTVNCTSRLSGMPDLTMTFKNSSLFDDASFHPCVRYSRYLRDRVLSFVPPDGFFQLMTYRTTGNLTLPLYVKPQITFTPDGSGKVLVLCGPKIQTDKLVLEDVSVTIPFPPNVTNTQFNATCGYTQFDEITKVCKWEIGRMPKEKTPQLTGSVSLPADEPLPEQGPTLLVGFRVGHYAITGCKVDVLTLHNEKYRPYKGIRYLTKAGVCEFRS